MKRSPNKVHSKKVEKKNPSSKGIVIKAHRPGPRAETEVKYADGLVRIYKREEEDINRFAAFARTLISK